MKQSESIKEIANALLVFHDEVNSIPKTATNPFFKSKYVPLDKILTAIMKPLKTANLSFMQFPTGENELETIIMHTSGEWMSASFKMKAEKSTPQAYGSVITYQRRYALSSILGLNTDEDDDGNNASDEKKTKPKKVTKPILTPDCAKWPAAIDYLRKDGKIKGITDAYEITEENMQTLILAAEL